MYSEFREIHHLVDNVCTVGGLLPGKTYAFRVKAKNEAGVRAGLSSVFIHMCHLTCNFSFLCEDTFILTFSSCQIAGSTSR